MAVPTEKEKAHMKFYIIGILGLILIVTSGCMDAQTLEGSGIMNVYGIDEAENGQLNTTSTFYEFGSQEESISRIVSGQGKTLMEGQKQMNYKLDFQLDPSTIQLELFGNDTAENGIIPYLRHASRSPSASNNRLLAISDTTANELMTKVKKLPGFRVNTALTNMINVNSEQDVIPKMTLHQFQRIYYDQGVDPVLPVLSYQNQEPRLRALALFQGDKLAGQIPIDQAFYINILHHNIHSLKQEVPLPRQPFKKYLREKSENDQDDIHTVFNIKKGTSKTKLVDKQHVTFHTQFNFDVQLLELTENVELDERSAISTLEQEIEKTIQEQYEQLLTTLQKQNVDPMGYGQIYNAKKRHGTLMESEWRDKFPDINVDVDVDVDILNQGMTP